jgi:hypothetical protein
MAFLDWSQCPAVESVPGKVSVGCCATRACRSRRFSRTSKQAQVSTTSWRGTTGWTANR